MRPSRFIGTFGGLGLLRPAPGTWGSLAALPIGYLLHGLGGFPLLALGTIVVTAAGVWACIKEQAITGVHDASEIVIDEVAGQWIALWPLSLGLWHAGVDPWVFPYPGWIGAFVMFRVFDIWKPGPVGWADRQTAPMWAMFDDIVAGAFAAITVAFAAAIAHGVIGL